MKNFYDFLTHEIFQNKIFELIKNSFLFINVLNNRWLCDNLIKIYWKTFRAIKFWREREISKAISKIYTGINLTFCEIIFILLFLNKFSLDTNI